MIKPSIKTNEYPYKDIKNSIKKGSIVSFEVNNNLNREITIDDYIDVKYNGKSFYKEDEE